MSITIFLNKTVDVKRLSDVSGSNKETYEIKVTGLPCRIQPITNEPELTGISGGFYQTYKLYCSENTDIEEGDRVEDGSTIYTVKGLIDREGFSNSALNHKKLILIKGK